MQSQIAISAQKENTKNFSTSYMPMTTKRAPGGLLEIETTEDYGRGGIGGKIVQ
jgi:hypothetical protein